MSGTEGDRPELGMDEERWLARLREGYAPPPPSSSERAAFDARLRGRLEAPPRHLRWLPVSVGAGLAAAVLAALLVLWPAPAPRGAGAVASAADDWADELLLEDGSGYGDAEEEDEALPPQYAAIASVWLER